MSVNRWLDRVRQIIGMSTLIQNLGFNALAWTLVNGIHSLIGQLRKWGWNTGTSLASWRKLRYRGDGNISADLLCITYFQGNCHLVCVGLRSFWDTEFPVLMLGQSQTSRGGWLVYLSTSNCAFEKPGKHSLRGIKQSTMLVAMVWEVPENFKCSLVVAISGPEMMMRDSLMECRF